MAAAALFVRVKVANKPCAYTAKLPLNVSLGSSYFLVTGVCSWVQGYEIVIA